MYRVNPSYPCRGGKKPPGGKNGRVNKAAIKKFGSQNFSGGPPGPPGFGKKMKEENLKQDFNLHGKRVFLSASLPTELEGTPRAQELFTFVTLFTREVVSANGKIVFGGHPTITPIVYEAAAGQEKRAVHIFQLKRFEPPIQIRDHNIFEKITWIGNGETTIEDELAQMRVEMAAASDAAVFIGGKNTDSLTEKPGIRDEFDRFMEKHPEGPVYLVGFMDGETHYIIKELETRCEKEKNSLTPKRLHAIHYERNIDLIVPFVLEDLAK